MTNLSKIRILTVFVIFGLVVSGLTAFPLLHELNLLAGFFKNEAGSLSPDDYSGMAHWIMKVREGLDKTYSAYPFVAYGTDWLAFGHVIIALFFVPVFLDPKRYEANFTVGIWACLLVIPLALICGPVRGIPFYWQLIDCSFGVVAIFPLLWARKLARALD